MGSFAIPRIGVEEEFHPVDLQTCKATPAVDAMLAQLEAAGGESGDEFEYSDLVAAHFGTDHQKIMITSDRLLPAVDAAIEAMSEPMVSHDCVAFYLLAEEVSRSVTVVQSGQGADEIFAGYD
jgi:asparagine synthetase B (glutamine-hydrolysing)